MGDSDLCCCFYIKLQLNWNLFALAKCVFFVYFKHSPVMIIKIELVCCIIADFCSVC